MIGVEGRSPVLFRLLRTATQGAIHGVGGFGADPMDGEDRHSAMAVDHLRGEALRQARDPYLAVDSAQRQATRPHPPELSWNATTSLLAKT